MNRITVLARVGRTGSSGPAARSRLAAALAICRHAAAAPLSDLACAGLSGAGLGLIALALPEAQPEALPAVANFIARVIVILAGSMTVLGGAWRKPAACAVLGEAGCDGMQDAAVNSISGLVEAVGAPLPEPFAGLVAAVVAFSGGGFVNSVLVQASTDTAVDALGTAVARLADLKPWIVRGLTSGLRPVRALGHALVSAAAWWVRGVVLLFVVVPEILESPPGSARRARVDRGPAVRLRTPPPNRGVRRN
jgi:hypothetical protein